MANVLSADKQIAVISALAEGSSIRSIERITGVHRDTVMRLGVRVGQGCARLLDGKMRDLPCTHRGSVRAKGHPTAGRVYAWAHDADDPEKPRGHVTVLHIPLVTSAVLAVKAAIVQEFKSGEPEEA
jgi:hypothetical protein